MPSCVGQRHPAASPVAVLLVHVAQPVPQVCRDARRTRRNARGAPTSLERGRGSGTGTISAMRPGRALISTTRSPSSTASSMLWVMKTTVSRRVLPDREQLLLEQAAGLLVHRTERLVHQQHARLARRVRGRCRRAAACRRTARSAAWSRTRRARPCRSARGPVPRARPWTRRASRRPNATLSSTVAQGSSAKFWNTMRGRARGRAPARRR